MKALRNTLAMILLLGLPMLAVSCTQHNNSPAPTSTSVEDDVTIMNAITAGNAATVAGASSF